jgi:hypothetical protein
LDFRLGDAHDAINGGVTARDGRTGAPLWSRSLDGAKGGISFPVPDPDEVGTPAKPGVLLINELEPIGGGAVTLTVTAISGAGKQVWTQTLTGQITITGDTETLTNVPIAIGDIHDVGTSGHDILVDVVNATLSESGAGAGSDQPEIISAADGSITTRGAPITSTAGVPEALPVPDLNGDGLDDLAVLEPGSGRAVAERGDIVAERGDTGAVIWTAVGVPVGQDADLEPVGYVSSASTEDLVVTNDNDDFSGNSTVSLVDGATGALLWTHTAACAFEIDKTGPKLRPAVGLVTDVTSDSGPKFSSARLSLAPRYSNGKVVFKRTIVVKATTTKSAHTSSFEVEFSTFGDVQPDGAQDLLIGLKTTIGTHTVRRRGVLSGRDGTLISEPLGFPTDGSLRRGAGTDLVKPLKGQHDVLLAGYDGATGKRYYQHQLAGTQGLRPRLAIGVRVTGHHCSDLSISASHKTRQLIGLFDAAAQPLWTVVSNQLVGGQVHKAKTPSRYCLA